MSDVVVIGAGVGGLSAAIACAAEGHEVLVVESATQAGGKLGSAVVEGTVIDTGPSVITLPHVFDDLLALAGAPPLEVVRPERWFRYGFPDGSAVELGNGLQGTLDGVRASLGRQAALQLESFLDQARRAWEVAAPRFVFGPAPSLRTLVSVSPQKLAAIRPFTTMWQAICQAVDDPRLRAILARFATYAGSDVRRAPAVLSTIAWVELGEGGFGVRGGMHRLSARLEGAARSLGVTFRFGAPVERILVERKAASGVRLRSGELLRTDAVICNGEAAHLFGELLPPALRKTLPGELSWSGRCVVLRVARRARPAHEVRFPRDYLGEMEDLSQAREPSQPALYLCAPRIAHEASVDEDLLFAMTNSPAGSADDPAWAGRVADSLGEPARVLWQRGPRELAEHFPGSGGALYGFASHSWRTAFARPKNRVPDVRGLYLAGGSAHPGAGLPLVAASGLRAAAELCADFRQATRRKSAAATGMAIASLLLAGGARAANLPAASDPEAGSAFARADARAAASPTLLSDLVRAMEQAFHVAEDAPEGERAARFDRAASLAGSAIGAFPRSADAHFWRAVSVASAARERGLLALLTAAAEVRRTLHQGEALDPHHGPILSALCSMYHRAPGWPLSFGDDELSRSYCRRALDQDPRSWEAHLVLADLARGDGDRLAATQHAEAILEGPLDGRQPRTHARYRRQIEELLQ